MKWDIKIIDLGFGTASTHEALLRSLTSEGWQLVCVNATRAYLIKPLG